MKATTQTEPGMCRPQFGPQLELGLIRSVWLCLLPDERSIRLLLRRAKSWSSLHFKRKRRKMHTLARNGSRNPRRYCGRKHGRLGKNSGPPPSLAAPSLADPCVDSDVNPRLSHAGDSMIDTSRLQKHRRNVKRKLRRRNAATATKEASSAVPNRSIRASLERATAVLRSSTRRLYARVTGALGYFHRTLTCRQPDHDDASGNTAPPQVHEPCLVDSDRSDASHVAGTLDHFLGVQEAVRQMSNQDPHIHRSNGVESI
jgi:hypothetical protein